MDILTLAQLNKLKKNGGAGYSETEKVSVLPQTEFVTELGCATETALESGKTYTVLFDGTPYTCVAIDGKGTVFLGDAGGEMGTGEPFYVVELGGAVGVAYLGEDTDTHTIEIYHEAETIHPIDPKYLPGVCLPVVEITSAEYPSGADLVALSEEESAALSALTGDYAIICLKASFPFMALLMARLTSGGITLWYSSDGRTLCTEDGVNWVMGG